MTYTRGFTVCKVLTWSSLMSQKVGRCEWWLLMKAQTLEEVLQETPTMVRSPGQKTFEGYPSGRGLWVVVLQAAIKSWLNGTHCQVVWSELYTVLMSSEASHRADSRFALSQWETVLLCNNVSHWLDANLESALLSLTGAWSCKCEVYTHWAEGYAEWGLAVVISPVGVWCRGLTTCLLYVSSDLETSSILVHLLETSFIIKLVCKFDILRILPVMCCC